MGLYFIDYSGIFVIIRKLMFPMKNGKIVANPQSPIPIETNFNYFSDRYNLKYYKNENKIYLFIIFFILFSFFFETSNRS